MKKVLFIDRDGTLVIEPPTDFQVDCLEKLEFYPKVFRYLSKIVEELNFELVMVTNQDGLGTPSFPEESFWPAHYKLIKAFENEGIVFNEILIDRSFPEDKASTRKPEIGMLQRYLSEEYDLENSYVIGDRITDMVLAKNLGTKGIFIADAYSEGFDREVQVLQTSDWKTIYEFLKLKERQFELKRTTSETEIYVGINLDGKGIGNISTGIAFFDHMLDQVARHGNMDLNVQVKGDLYVDEHHTIEDTAIVLGEALYKALGNKSGIERYGYCLPMDDCLAQVVIDFGGRNWIVWDVEFKREMIGKMPTEMFFHFFKSFSDSAKCNINIKAEGKNEHHKIEAIFKAFAKAIKMAIKRDVQSNFLPTTKGLI